MRLLVLTQKVDQNDDILGFFHGWLKAFARDYERIEVVALEVHSYTLPENISVHSLGKEKNVSKASYVLRFFSLIWKLRGTYDVVLIHMNPEYLMLGGILWRVLGKKIVLWYNHKKGSFWLNVGHALAHKILYTSPSAYTSRFKNARMMPVGIDTNVFAPNKAIQKEKHSVLSLGRISPVKELHVLVKALLLLQEKGIQFKADIYGDSPPQDKTYEEELSQQAKPLQRNSFLTFYKGVAHHKTPGIFSQHAIFVNMTPPGSFDKTILEAMASGCLVLTCNDAIKEAIGEEGYFPAGDAKVLAEKLKVALERTESEREEQTSRLISYVKEHHSLLLLSSELKNVFTSLTLAEI